MSTLLEQQKQLLSQLSSSVKVCKACSICEDEANGRPTPFSGSPTSGLFLLFRNPGITENKKGLPCIGRVKPFVDRFLSALSLTREDTIIANALCCYTSKDRDPSDEEVSFCAGKHFLPLLKECKPRVIVAFGKRAGRFVSGGKVESPRRKEITFLLKRGEGTIQGIVAEHPGSFLGGRNPSLIRSWLKILKFVSKHMNRELDLKYFPEFKEISGRES